MDVRFYARDFSKQLYPSMLEWNVERLEWRAVGGPHEARLRADVSRGGDVGRLWRLLEWLRCPVTVNDTSGPAWWGYISAVEIHAGRRVLRLDLDSMANDVAISYNDQSPIAMGGELKDIGFLADDLSVAAYGRKQRRLHLGAGSNTSAAAMQKTMLKQHGWPMLENKFEGLDPETDVYAILEARGWWSTLDWMFYADDRGNEGNRESGSVISVGNTAGTARLAQSFQVTAAWAASGVWLKVKRFRANDSLTMEICSDTAGAPGTVLKTITKTAAQLSDEVAWTLFSFGGSYLNLAISTTYWIKVYRSGATDAAAYHQLSGEEGLKYPRGVFRFWNGTAWVARVPDCDLTFLVEGARNTKDSMVGMLATGGQFFTTVRADDGSSVIGRLYRDGSRTALEEVEELLKMGNANGDRMLAQVGVDRVARIYVQPDVSTANLQVGLDGQITSADGRPLAACQWPAGKWAKLGPMSTAVSLLGNSGAVFLEGCEWDGKVMRVSKL